MMPIPLLGCIPVIADTDVGSYNVGLEQVARAITPRTRAIVITHNCGEPADVHAIAALATAEEIPLVEDCSQAHGATLRGRLVGSFGHIAAFSTSHFKHHCTGGQGGMVFTRSPERIALARRASDRGKPFDLPEGSSNAFASFNFNLDDLACVIGIEQLKKLPAVVARRRAVVSQFEEALSQAPLASIRVAAPIADAEPSYLSLRIRVILDRLRCNKDTFARAVQGEGIPVIPSYAAKHMPHAQDWFRHRRVFAGSLFPWNLVEPHEQAPSTVPCPNADTAASEHFLLCVHERWGDQEIADTITALQKVERRFAR
jgi:dTDP-4-amino-4,6-dideoxygalactose transaminase